MKKSLAVLTFVSILGIAGTAFAANPFQDVPNGHWSYSAVSQLTAAGIIEDEGGAFNGDKTLTRYELATIVARAMTKEDKANAEQKALIQKLATEYKGELEGLGVRVQNLERKANRMDVSGNARVRYNTKDINSDNTTKTINLDINCVYNVGGGWAIKTESEWERKIDDPSDAADDSDMMSTQCEQLYVTDGKQLNVGKFSYMPGYGLTFYSKANGVMYTMGDRVKTNLYWGHSNLSSNATIKAADAVFALNEKTNVRADYQHVEDVTDGDGYNKYYGVGFDTKLGNVLTLQAAAAKSDIGGSASDEKAYFTQLQYKAADYKVTHSKDLFVAYSKIPDAVAYDRDDAGDYTTDFKGVKLGFDYVPMKNILVSVWYLTGKDISTDVDLNVGRVQAQFFF